MDGPPVIAAIARISTGLFGSSVWGLRVLPPVAGGLIIVLAARVAQALGGGRPAQIVGALGVALSPMLLGASNLLQPVVFDQLAWTLVLYATIRLIGAPSEEATRWWALLGVAGGFGVLTKFVIGILFFALAVSAAATRAWRRADWPGLALALGLAAAIGSPSLVGQIRLGFPILGQLRELHTSQLVHVTALNWARTMLFLAPTSVLAIAGAALLIGRASYRIVGLACVVAFLTILVLHGKFYYALPIFPTLWGAGGVAVETARGRWRGWLRVGVPIALAVNALLLALFALPLLPPPLMVRYEAALGVVQRTDKGEALPLPSDFADMLGWREQVAAVARVYDRLAPAEQRNTVLLARNYGEAGALDFYGPGYGLPRALTNQGTYYLFGPGDRSGTTAIAIGIDRQTLEGNYDSITLADHIDAAYAVPEESHLDIYLCRGAHETIQAVWPRLAGRY
jgi:hypothetical protein